MFKSLKSRLIFRFSVILILILTIFVIGFSYLSNQNQSNKILAQMREMALNSEAKLLSQNELPEGELSINLPKHSAVALIKDGQIIAKSKDYNPKLCKDLAGSNKEFLLRGYEHLSACYWERFTEPFRGAVVLQRWHIENDTEDARETLLIILIPVSLLLLYTAWRLIDRILNPIEMMTQSIKQVRVDNFSRTIPNVSNDKEIKALTQAYNEMIIRLREGITSLEQFNSDIAHELRTPLSVMLGEIELALRKDRNKDYYQDTLKRVHKESKYLQKLIERLLLLGRYTKDNIASSFEVCRLDVMVDDVIDRYSLQIEKKELIINKSIQSPLEMRCNKTLIGAVISNLIDNAIKYSPFKGTIDIVLQKKSEQIYFEVSNSGKGIAKENLEKLTKRFYREDNARSRQVEGVGLGLAIVEKAVRLHNGKIEFYSGKKEGLRVKVVLQK